MEEIIFEEVICSFSKNTWRHMFGGIHWLHIVGVRSSGYLDNLLFHILKLAVLYNHVVVLNIF